MLNKRISKKTDLLRKLRMDTKKNKERNVSIAELDLSLTRIGLNVFWKAYIKKTIINEDKGKSYLGLFKRYDAEFYNEIITERPDLGDGEADADDEEDESNILEDLRIQIGPVKTYKQEQEEGENDHYSRIGPKFEKNNGRRLVSKWFQHRMNRRKTTNILKGSLKIALEEHKDTLNASLKLKKCVDEIINSKKKQWEQWKEDEERDTREKLKQALASGQIQVDVEHVSEEMSDLWNDRVEVAVESVVVEEEVDESDVKMGD